MDWICHYYGCMTVVDAPNQLCDRHAEHIFKLSRDLNDISDKIGLWDPYVLSAGDLSNEEDMADAHTQVEARDKIIKILRSL